MTTKAAERDHDVVQGTRAALVATLIELENRAIAHFRTVWEPAAEARHRAEEIGDEESAQRAALLQASVLLREGRVGEGGRIAHQAAGGRNSMTARTCWPARTASFPSFIAL